MRLSALLIFSIFLTGCWIPEGQDDGYGGQGEIAFEYRQFRDDGNDVNSDNGLAVFTRVEANYEWVEVKNVFRGFARVDDKDPDRSLIAIEDAYVSMRQGANDEWKFLAGYKIFNWTATEAFHPADVINSRNLDSDLENLEKKGELTFEIERAFFDGALSFYAFPYHTEPEFPGFRSRLGGGVVIDKPIWVDGDDKTTNSKWSFQWAIRLTQDIWDGDFSFHVLNHMDRDRPLIGTSDFTILPGVGALPNNASKVTTPHYFRVFQIGGTYQKPLESLIVKLEAAHRKYDTNVQVLTAEGLLSPVDHTDVAVGLEYPLEWGDGMETFFIFEGQMTIGPTKLERARINVFQRDVLFGFRHAFNDVMGKELFASVIADVEREREFLFNASYTQRISDNWKVKMGVRVYEAPQKGSVPRGLEILDRDNHGHFTITRFF